MGNIGIFGHLVSFTAKWYILWPLGIFGGHLVGCSEKNLVTMVESGQGYVGWQLKKRPKFSK
jgi:hypothetical protein